MSSQQKFPSPPKELRVFLDNLPKDEHDWQQKRQAKGVDTWEGLRSFVQGLIHGSTNERNILNVFRVMLCIVDLKTGRSMAEVNNTMGGFINETKPLKLTKSEDHHQRLRASAFKLLKCMRRLSERIGYRAYECVLLHGPFPCQILHTN